MASKTETTIGAHPCVQFPHCFCWMKARGYCQAREEARKREAGQ